MANVVGVFYVLSGGSIFALILDFTLILLETLKVSREMKVRSRRNSEIGMELVPKETLVFIPLNPSE